MHVQPPTGVHHSCTQAANSRLHMATAALMGVRSCSSPAQQAQHAQRVAHAQAARQARVLQEWRVPTAVYS